MKNIPTQKELDALQYAYREALGKNVPNDTPAAMEFKLLQMAYADRFGEGISLFEVGIPHDEVNDMMRHCLDTGIPYEYPELPEGCLA